jgi:hypothetical protein
MDLQDEDTFGECEYAPNSIYEAIQESNFDLNPFQLETSNHQQLLDNPFELQA